MKVEKNGFNAISRQKKSNFLIYDWDSVYGAFAQSFSSIIYTRFDLYKKKIIGNGHFSPWFLWIQILYRKSNFQLIVRAKSDGRLLK